MNFVLVNLKSLEDADTYTKDKKLKGNAMHCTGSAPSEYGLMYIPHKVLVSADGLVVKNFQLDLQKDLDDLLATGGKLPQTQSKKEEKKKEEPEEEEEE